MKCKSSILGKHLCIRRQHRAVLYSLCIMPHNRISEIRVSDIKFQIRPYGFEQAAKTREKLISKQLRSARASTSVGNKYRIWNLVFLGKSGELPGHLRIGQDGVAHGNDAGVCSPIRVRRDESTGWSHVPTRVIRSERTAGHAIYRIARHQLFVSIWPHWQRSGSRSVLLI
jgi:hypothetical protein